MRANWEEKSRSDNYDGLYDIELLHSDILSYKMEVWSDVSGHVSPAELSSNDK